MSSGQHQTFFGIVGTGDVRLVNVNAKHFFPRSCALALQVVPPSPAQERLGSTKKIVFGVCFPGPDFWPKKRVPFCRPRYSLVPKTGPFSGPKNGPKKRFQNEKKQRLSTPSACFRSSPSERPFCFFTLPKAPFHRRLNRRTHWILLFRWLVRGCRQSCSLM